ncbi:SRPBCC family protein [Polyangium jinanense]|uniref:SRPBCC family protein n=1 Tax=Polyangium jinanense TaxID=2829994 RepID=A0A9X3X3W3_9BACT|nr:SRPBCC family protein [Polyangium jinanense]MDC3959907.1 SRPBCC family protein [Polyangium jinanense]MDC3983787.1 SRPBCC family protein [Polyangium jinanense]
MARRFLALFAVLGALVLAWPGQAHAGALTADEKTRLARGEVVKRTFDVELPEGDFIGGLGYVLIAAPPADVMAVLLDPGSYRYIFPLTQEARLVSRKGDDFFLTFRQGGAKVSGEYTVRARRETPSLVRFWMDPTRPHDIGDCWGFFRVDPADDGKTLLTYGALLHLEFGVIKLLFEEKIRSYALQTPELLRRYVEDRRGPLP